ncbi:MAG: transcriptional regulator [Methylophaga sp.]|nr:MAG: transcriptional regulator [Methylophaga sp.]
MPSTSLGDALFTKTQQRVLGLLYGKPDARFYTNEILRLAGMGRGTITRILDSFVSSGVLVSLKEGNQRYYQANSQNPIYNELVSIVRKTFGITDVIKATLESVSEQIVLAFVYGSIAKGEDTASSDIDLMVITDNLSYSDLMTVLADAEESLARPINPTIYTPLQFRERIEKDNSFLTRVIAQPKLWIKGNDDDVATVR